MCHLMPICQKYQGLFIDMLKCLVNNNPKGFPNTQYGITPSNYYRGHQHHCPEDSYASPKTRSKKYQKLWPNTYQEEPSDQALDHMPQTFSLSKRRMANYARYKTIILSTNEQRKIGMYPH